MLSPEFLSSGSLYYGPNKCFSRRVNLQSYHLQFGWRNSHLEKSTGFCEGFFLLRCWLKPRINQALEFQITMRLIIHCLNWMCYPCCESLFHGWCLCAWGYLKAPQDQVAQKSLYLLPKHCCSFQCGTNWWSNIQAQSQPISGWKNSSCYLCMNSLQLYNKAFHCFM